MFKKIVVGIDGSESAAKAVDVAATMAVIHGAELILVHAVQLSAIAEQAIKGTATEHLGDKPKRIMDQLSRDILDAGTQRAAAAGLDRSRIKTASTDGNQARRLIQAAKEQRCDLIVVGSHGHGRLEGLLLGSVSQKVAALAPCPCLIVR